MTGLDLPGRVESALDAWARSRMQSHYGDVEVESISAEGDVSLKFTGACTSCPLRPMTFVATILPVLENIEGVRSVTVRGLLLSEPTVQRIRASVAPPVTRTSSTRH